MTTPDGLADVVDYIRGQRLLADPAALHRRLTTMEEHMSATDDKVAEIRTVLGNIQGDVTRLAADLQAARDAIAAQDPALAAKLDPILEQARAIDAATPEPAPVEPAPGTPAEPTA